MHTMERYFTNTTDVDLIDRMGEGLLVAATFFQVAASEMNENLVPSQRLDLLSRLGFRAFAEDYLGGTVKFKINQSQ